MPTGLDTPPDPPWIRVPLRASWNDLVLPEKSVGELQAIEQHWVRRRSSESTTLLTLPERTPGILTLFSGPSGTGKTLAAEVLANEIALDLYRIDLSSVASNYIGETERNLERVFDAAEHTGAILLFEEADALFGKRSEVKDSHDRYANIEIGYLLQRMEAYPGLAILTTNLRDAIDPAFIRRMHYVVEFPLPDVAARDALWRRAFPPGTECHDLDLRQLAKLELSGGTIRDIAQRASLQAATAASPITMRQVLEATEAELLKVGRLRSMDSR